MSFGNQLSIDCWLKIVYYLDLDDIISLSECYPQIQEIFYFKSVVSDILIRNLTVSVTGYILNFPKDRRHLVETLDISYIRVKPHSTLENFIISLTGLTAFWAFENMQKSTYRLILKKMGPQLHTLGIHENFGHHQGFKRKLKKLKHLFIEAGTGYSKIDLTSPCLRTLYRKNYKRAKIILDNHRLPDLALHMILKFARNVEYLWVEPGIQINCNIEEFANFKEFVLADTTDSFFYHEYGPQAFVRFYRSLEIKESQIIKKFGLRHLRYSKDRLSQIYEICQKHNIKHI